MNYYLVVTRYGVATRVYALEGTPRELVDDLETESGLLYADWLESTIDEYVASQNLLRAILAQWQKAEKLSRDVEYARLLESPGQAQVRDFAAHALNAHRHNVVILSADDDGQVAK